MKLSALGRRALGGASLLLFSFSSQAAIYASDLDVSFSGNVQYLDDPNSLLSAHNLSIGDSFTAGYSLDQNAQVLSTFTSAYNPQITVHQVDSSSVSMIVDFANSSQLSICPCVGPTSASSVYVLIGNDVSYQSETGQVVGDVWGLEIIGSGPSNVDFIIGFTDSSGTMFDNEDFFVNNSVSNWDSAKALFGTLGTPYDIHMEGSNQVPIPAASWLFGSALMGLGAARRKCS